MKKEIKRTDKDINDLYDKCSKLEEECADEYAAAIKATIDWLYGGTNPIE